MLAILSDSCILAEMKFEKFKAPNKTGTSALVEAVKTVQIGNAVRLKTAAQHFKIYGRLSSIGKKRGVQFGQTCDGEDVLIFIKPTP